MDVIPVLDLKHGRAVHACRGERAAYAPVAGVFGSGDDPIALARALRDDLGARRLYVADLDALTGGAGVSPLVAALAALGLELWVDAGVRTPAAAGDVLSAGAARAIVALETLPRLAALGEIVQRLGAARLVFSLDLRAGRPVAADPALATTDPVAIADAAARAGFDTILAIDVARVGSESGPDEPLLRRLHAALPGANLVAGGGIRHPRDLARLARLGCGAALVATAFHTGRLGRADVERVAARTGSGTPAGGSPASRRLDPLRRVT